MLRTQVIKTYPERLSYSPWHQVYLLSTSQCVSPHNVAETHLAPASFIALTTESGLCGLLLVPPSFRQLHPVHCSPDSPHLVHHFILACIFTLIIHHDESFTAGSALSASGSTMMLYINPCFTYFPFVTQIFPPVCWLPNPHFPRLPLRNCMVRTFLLLTGFCFVLFLYILTF